MMATLFRMIAATTICLTVSACIALAEEPVRVVGTVSPLSDIVRKIGGKHVVVSTVLAQGTCPSEYVFHEHHLGKMKNTDLVIRIGEGADPWSDRLIAAAPGVMVINAARREDLAVSSRYTGQSEPVSAGSSLPQLYVWLDPRIVRDRIAPAILQALIELRPARGAEFKSNSRRLFFELTKMDNETGALLAQMPQKPFFTQTGAWNFFFNHYGLSPVEVIESDEKSDISAERMVKIIAKGRLEGVHLIFRSHRPPSRSLVQISRKLDAAIIPLGVMGSEHPGVTGSSYLEMMQTNIKKLLLAFH